VLAADEERCETGDRASCSEARESEYEQKDPGFALWGVVRPVFARSMRPSDQLRDHTGQKRRYWLVCRFKGNNTRRHLLFSACVGVGMVLVTSKQHFRFPYGNRRHFAPRNWWSCSATASGSRATHGGRGDVLPQPQPQPPSPLGPDFFRAISAGERGVLSSKRRGPVWRQAQLTDAIGLSGAAVVENYYVAAHLACCLMQCNLVLRASAHLARD
jgi:hypothetical protein